MAFEGDLTNLGLADIFQTLGMNRQSGTLVVKHGDMERRFYFTDDGVSLLTSRSARKFRLGNLLVGMGKLQEADLKVAVLKQERSKETKLGDILVQTGLVKDEDIKEACRYQSAEEIYESFAWKSGKFQFLEGANAGPAGGPGPFADFFFEVTDVVMEAARRADEYALNLQKIGEFEEFWVRKEPGPLPEARAGRTASLLHAMLDGTLDVNQVFEEFHLSAFDTSQAFAALIESGAIAPMGAPELEAEAKKFLAAKQHERAAKLLARAAHHDPKNPALLQELSDAQAAAGARKEAGVTLTALGRLLAESQQRTEAIETLRRAVEFDSRLEAAYELLMDVHASLEQQDKAEAACREAARLLSDDRNFESALRLLDRGLGMVPTSIQLRLQRANCLLAMDRKEEGIQELIGIARVLEDGKGEDPKLLLGIYRKLQQLDPANASHRERVEALVAGEKAREARKRLLKAASVCGVLVLAVTAWFLRPESASTRLERLELRLAEHPAYTDAVKADFEEMAAEAAALESKFETGSEEDMRRRQVSTQLEARRTAPARVARIKVLEERIRDDVLAAAAALLQKGEYPAGIRRTLAVQDLLNGPETVPLQGDELNSMRTRIQEEVRKALAVPADKLRAEWKTIQAALSAVSAVDLQKADEDRMRQVFETAEEARKARGRADWPATVDALAEAVRTFGEVEGIRISELRAILDGMESTSATIEDTYHRARAGVLYAEVRRLYTETLREVRDSKERGDVARGIAACRTFLDRCDSLRREEPRSYFAQYTERLFDVLKVDAEVRESLAALDAARFGLESAKEAEARGDLQGAFDILRRTIAAAQDVNFQGLILLPLRVTSRPEGGKVIVTLPGQEPLESGTTPVTLRYPYQGTTVIRVEVPGFEPATLERQGVAKDRRAVVTVEMQRTLRWRREAGDAVEGRPGLAPGLVLVGTRGGLFRALDAATGDERFQIKTDHLSGISGGILVEEGTAYFGGNDGEAFAVDVAKKAFRWRKKTGSAVSTTPVRVGDLAVFGDSDGRVHAFRAAGGEEAWTAELRSPVAADPLAAGDRVLVALADGRLVCLKAADGTEAWTATLSGPATALAPDGRGGVLVPTDASTFDRVDLAAGTVTWSAKTDAPVRARPVPRAGGFLAVSSQGTIHAFGPDGRETAPRVSLERPVDGGCVALGDTLYVAAAEGTLVAWDLKKGEVAWALGGLGQLRGEPAVDPGILVVASAGGGGAVVVLDP